MDRLIDTARNGAVPDASSPAYRLLSILSDGEAHSRDELCQALGGGLRSYIQKLTGRDCEYWLIDSETKEHSGRRQAFYRLNERHLSGERDQDEDARTIAKKRYRDRSHLQAANGLRRYKAAFAQKALADQEYLERFSKKEGVR